MRKLRIWVPIVVLVICLGVLTMRPLGTEKAIQKSMPQERVYKYAPKSAPMAPGPSIPVGPKTDYMDIGLKVGSLLGGLMTLLNIIEKVVNMVRRKGPVVG